MPQPPKDEETSIAGIFIIIGVGWAIIIAGFFAREISESQSHTKNLALQQGRSFFQEITITRAWSAFHARGVCPDFRIGRAQSLSGCAGPGYCDYGRPQTDQNKPGIYGPQIAELAAK